ncbi:Sodium- and chloride-dependent glycine transporter 1 [Holothuria leucospilota]|uniref:Sodium- and chloride-dependent glycine transporter 1 n=1 Tax=Holothuria leucospilota TaxID=206669 RepID=A0A9Q1H8C3_HOLLE|nr:Sodium- and chloride-dependent glycine transporter 1 [Holothuria leucospilota]
MLLFTGLPMMFLEMAFGQYASQGVITVWKAVPLLRGIGYGMLLATGIGNISFMLVTAYILFYLFASFRRTLPWIGCNNEWNTVLCSELLSDCISKSSIIAANGSCVNPEYMTSQELLSYGVAVTPSGEYNFSNYVDPFDGKRVRPTEEYWK